MKCFEQTMQRYVENMYINTSLCYLYNIQIINIFDDNFRYSWKILVDIHITNFRED